MSQLMFKQEAPVKFKYFESCFFIYLSYLFIYLIQLSYTFIFYLFIYLFLFIYLLFSAVRRPFPPHLTDTPGEVVL